MLVENTTWPVKSVEFVLMFELVEDIRDRVRHSNTSGNLVVPRVRHSNTSGNSVVPKYKTGFGGKAIQVYSPLLWNTLPTDIKLSKALGIFKSSFLKFPA